MFTLLSLVMSMMVSFLCYPFFPRDVLDEIWVLTESLSEGFTTYAYNTICPHIRKIIHSPKVVASLLVQMNKSHKTFQFDSLSEEKRYIAIDFVRSF